MPRRGAALRHARARKARCGIELDLWNRVWQPPNPNMSMGRKV
eukprot:CAMPEP_0206490598 /NCGR_PEP_ID=MMETSP0324_2-20121206/44239_1 /ASSEMBLY_ACC=CAM_ASM_000836 /TAXON_ID=2866 /ORGANISM="Crypthecodinium cohnii, Strain Seligo" /LENGTH=42 /DNA_ID= /DNA_START= /DNA_END= /DNA_ORIENTATION=